MSPTQVLSGIKNEPSVQANFEGLQSPPATSREALLQELRRGSVPQRSAQQASGEIETPTLVITNASELKSRLDRAAPQTDNSIKGETLIVGMVANEPTDTLVARGAGINAALKANPDMTVLLLVSRTLPEGKTQEDAKTKYVEELGIDKKHLHNIVLVPTSESDRRWHEDPFQQSRGDVLWEPKGQHYRGAGAAEDIAKVLQLEVREASFKLGAGGDVHFVTGPTQETKVFVGYETLNKNLDGARERLQAENKLDQMGFGPSSDTIFAIAEVMAGMERDFGIPPRDVIPLTPTGGNGRTYGDALAKLSEEQRTLIPKNILEELEKRKDHPLPTIPAGLGGAREYHLDLYARVVTGRDGRLGAVIGQPTDPSDPAELRGRQDTVQTLKAHDIDTIEMLPAATVEKDGRVGLLNYTNAEIFRDRENRLVVLMPTEAIDKDKLTALDQQALEAWRRVLPSDAVVIPIGGNTAAALSLAGGPNCRMQVSELKIDRDSLRR